MASSVPDQGIRLAAGEAEGIAAAAEERWGEGGIHWSCIDFWAPCPRSIPRSNDRLQETKMAGTRLTAF